MSRFSDNEELNALVEAARKLPPMTPAQRREQAISFAYGNVNLDRVERGDPPIAREVFEAAYDRLHRVDTDG